MISEKRTTLKPIIESQDGVHLTAYLVNRGDLIDLKAQLREMKSEVSVMLKPVMTTDGIKKFLEPIDGLLHDARIFKHMNGNIGIFRTNESFRILNIPVELESQFHVATSFHVKPLLKWMQIDREFLVLGISENSAHLYLGSQTAIQRVDSIIFPEVFKNQDKNGDYESLKRSRNINAKSDETYIWINEWLNEITQKASPRLFIAGDEVSVARLTKKLKYKNLIKTPVAPFFSENHLSEICQSIRKLLKLEAKKNLEQALLEFRFAEEVNLAKKNIFQIAKAAVQGKVKKLIVAEGINLFGKIDKKTGGLAIHPFDLDHEDDDLLDDLAQTVLASGGEVIVAKREDIPKGRPVLAILGETENLKEKTENSLEFENIKERSSV